MHSFQIYFIMDEQYYYFFLFGKGTFCDDDDDADGYSVYQLKVYIR